MYFDQAGFDLRCEWGLTGLRAIQAGIDVVVVVDVLSFSTAVDIAVSRGAAVYPYRWKYDSAEQFAKAKGALLAGERSEDGFSLSPSSLCSINAGALLVLPSPNGAALSLETGGLPTFTACLRNAHKVARCATARGRRIAVIPAGEHWQDGSIRPCAEDLIGAGAVLFNLPGTRSPKAEAAIAAFTSARPKLIEAFEHCSSGRELIGRGFFNDVNLAAEYGVSDVASLPVDHRFVNDPASLKPRI